MHLFTDYKITEKSLSDMTVLQYKVVFEITNQIVKYKMKGKPMVVI